MSKKLRLQVLMEEAELQALRKLARRKRTTVATVVREALAAAYNREPSSSPAAKLARLRAAARHEPPGREADIDQMLAEIESGYLRGMGR
jgi:hypothetical protein